MRLKLNYISFSIIIFVILFLLRLGWLYLFIPDEQVMSKQGEVNIPHSFIENDDYVYIEGEWLVTNGKDTSLVDINKQNMSYEGVVKSEVNISTDAFFTTPITLYIPSSPYQTKVYIDDELVKTQLERQGTTYQSYSITFMPKSKSFKLSMEFGEERSNVKFPASERYIAISSERGIDLRINLDNVLTLFMNSTYILVIVCLVAFYLFLKSSKLVLYIIVIYFFSTFGELYKLAVPYIEWIRIPYNFEAKLFVLSYFLSNLVLILSFRYLSGNNKIPYINYIVTLYTLTLAVLVLMPVEFVNMASVYLIAFYAVWIIYCFTYLIRRIYLSKYEMYSLIYVALSVFSGLIWGVIKTNIHYHIPFYLFDYLGMQLGFIGFWFNRYLSNSKKIEKSEKQKEEFLQKVSEQLSMPLNKLELDLDEQCINENNPCIRSKLNEMSTTVRGMSYILNNWLDYSKLKDNNLQMQKQPVDVVSTIKYVCDVMIDSLDIPELNIKIEAEKDIDTITADSKLLSQALYNLIYYQLENMEHKKIYIECKHVDDFVVITIEDASKVGEHKHLWKTPSDAPILIQICDSIIEEQGGCLEVKGNGFVIRLKRQEEGSIERESFHIETDTYELEAQPKVNTTESMSILAYSTELSTLTILQSVLDGTKDSMTQANTYQDFLAYYTSQTWDLIVLDSTLNDSSSLSILNMIRSRYNLIDLPVLMLLIPTTTNFVSTFFKQGMNDYVTRPIHAIELKYKVHTLLATKRLVDERLQLEASLLQNQIEPHFLFNTLNAIASLSKIDVDRMVTLLEQFGHYLSRGFKKRLMKKLIGLEDEIDIVRSYLYIEELRYEPYLKVEWDVDDIKDVQIPPYAIQTIVENAIKHGIRKKRYGGTVSISVKTELEFVIIKVSDDGIGMSQDKVESLFRNDSENGIGIYNTHLRLISIFGIGLKVESVVNKGTSVIIQIPKKK